jgi:hypothetical protein
MFVMIMVIIRCDENVHDTDDDDDDNDYVYDDDYADDCKNHEVTVQLSIG